MSAVEPADFRGIKNPVQRLVLIELAGFAKRARAWPSEATLAECIGCCVKTVRKAIRGLEALGEIRVWRRHKRRNVYYLRRISDPESTRRAPKRLPLQGSPQSTRAAGSAPSSPLPARRRDARAADGAPAESSRTAAAPAAQPQLPLPKPEKTVLPDGWLPSEEDRNYAYENTDHDANWCGRQLAKFHEYHRLHGRVSARWDLEWRFWIRIGLDNREKWRAQRERRRRKPHQQHLRHATAGT